VPVARRKSLVAMGAAIILGAGVALGVGGCLGDDGGSRTVKTTVTGPVPTVATATTPSDQDRAPICDRYPKICSYPKSR
jgi:hypothetical protein